MGQELSDKVKECKYWNKLSFTAHWHILSGDARPPAGPLSVAKTSSEIK